MKKLLFGLVLISIPAAGHACSACNVEYSEAEKKAFFIATSLLIVVPFLLAFYLYKYLKGKY